MDKTKRITLGLFDDETETSNVYKKSIRNERFIYWIRKLVKNKH